MLKVKYDILKDILNGCEIEYADNFKSTELIDKDIVGVNGIPFKDFIIAYADERGIPVLFNGYQYEYGLMSANSKAISLYGLYPNTIFLPLSDGLLGLMSNFIDEYDMYESKTFIKRSYEVFKIISDEMKDIGIIIFDMEEEL